MDRRAFLRDLCLLVPACCSTVGCRSGFVARIAQPTAALLPGRQPAGIEACGPPVREAVAQLLARHVAAPVLQASFTGSEPVPPPVKRICIVTIDEATADERDDVAGRLHELVDQRIAESQVFESLPRRAVDAGLRDGRLRPDDLVVPENRRAFAALLEQQGQPIDYLLFARLAAGADRQPRGSRRPPSLNLELVDIRTGTSDTQPVEIGTGPRSRRPNAVAPPGR